jgi:pimeloyl-ACP methyl ester carboxylesterase
MPSYGDVKAVALSLQRTFGGILGGFTLQELLLGLSYLSKYETEERDNSCSSPLPGSRLPRDDPTVAELHERMPLAAAAYLSSAQSISDQISILNSPFSLRRCEPQGSFRDPSFFVALSEAQHNELAICIRGTASMHDALTDGLVEHRELLPGCFAHAGIAAAAEYMVEKTEHDVSSHLQRPHADDAPPPTVTFLGHSLGGGVAALSALIWRKRKAHSDLHSTRIRALCYAPPPLADEATAHEASNLGVVSCAVGHDFVPRGSAPRIIELRERLRAINWQSAALEDVKETSAGRTALKVYGNMKSAMKSVASSGKGQQLSRAVERFVPQRMHEKTEEVELKTTDEQRAEHEASHVMPLHVIGELIHFRTCLDGSVTACSNRDSKSNPTHMLGRIELSPTLVTDHLTAAIREALERHYNGKPHTSHEGYLLKQQGGKRRLTGTARWVERFFRVLPKGGQMYRDAPVLAYTDHPRSLINRNELLLNCYVPERLQISGRGDHTFALMPLTNQSEEIRLEASNADELQTWMDMLTEACSSRENTVEEASSKQVRHNSAMATELLATSAQDNRASTSSATGTSEPLPHAAMFVGNNDDETYGEDAGANEVRTAIAEGNMGWQD